MSDWRGADRQASFWFVASTTALAGPLLFAVVFAIDRLSGPAGVFEGLVISPTSARTILGTIAGSLMTIASLTSSLTIVTLQLPSNQYTPRAIRGFLRTRLAQAVFGSLVGIFVYCLLLLVTVRAPGEENEPFVPSLGLAVAIALALASLLLLVMFVHRLSRLIQVSTATAEIAAETARVVAAEHPEPFGTPAADAPAPTGTPVRADRSGYVQAVDRETLAGLGTPVELLVAAGDYLTVGTIVATTTAAEADVLAAVRIGTERDLDQDASFGVRQICDVAVRALGPGINDPTTGVTCIHHLRPVLESLAGRALERRVVRGALTFASPSFDDYLLPVWDIPRYGIEEPRVMAELLRSLRAVAAAAQDAGAEQRATDLRALVDDLERVAREHARFAADRLLLGTGAA